MFCVITHLRRNCLRFHNKFVTTHNHFRLNRTSAAGLVTASSSEDDEVNHRVSRCGFLFLFTFIICTFQGEPKTLLHSAFCGSKSFLNLLSSSFHKNSMLCGWKRAGRLNVYKKLQLENERKTRKTPQTFY